MIIAFTGHRTIILAYSSDLDIISRHELVNGEPYSNTWIHGGANGFDSQVQDYIRKYNIYHNIFRPDYEKYKDNPKYAPLVRNYKMIDICNYLVALWDGRQSGGTYATIQYAIKMERPWINLYNPNRIKEIK